MDPDYRFIFNTEKLKKSKNLRELPVRKKLKRKRKNGGSNW
jgi:hypothetical protein